MARSLHKGPFVAYHLLEKINKMNKIDEKKIIKTQTFKKGEAFLGIPNTWHVSENRGSEDLIFMIHWLGEKDKPVAFLEEK